MEPSAGLVTLPECDRRFRLAFTHAAIGVAIVDAEGACIYVNRAFCRISGYEEHELLRLTFSATLHPEDRDSQLKMFEQLVSGEISNYIGERRLIHKDGQVVWIRLSTTLPEDDVRQSQITILVEDITGRKQAEGALRASEERFRIAAENASDLIYEWDLRTGEMGVFGPNQRLGDWPMPLSYDAWKRIVHPEDLERVLSASARHIQNGERYSDEYRIVGRNGKVYRYSNRGQVMLTVSGEP